MLLLHLNKNKSIPLFQQVIDQVKELINQGSLKAGDRLPSSRKLAADCGVNRTTIFKAYEELWAMGYLESRQGSYSTVRKPAQFTKDIDTENISSISWILDINPSINKEYILKADVPIKKLKGSINFRPLSPDPGLMPTEDFRKSLNHILHNEKANVLNYGDAQGYEPLRKYIAKHQQMHQIHTSVNEILITNGTQNGLDLILRLYCTKETNIAIGSPSYNSAIHLIASHTDSITEIPILDTGLDLDFFEEEAKKQSIKMLYTMPNFQNPTGITTSQKHRERLLAICEKHHIIILEDGFEEEMKYFDKAVLPLKSIDRNQIVIYLGTFSKILFPGLRVGWICAHKQCIQQLTRLKELTEITGNLLSQAAVFSFCDSGLYNLHKKRIHKVYKRRMSLAIKAMKEYFPSWVEYTKPMGGYTLWVFFYNTSITELEIITQLEKVGVLITPGSNFYYQSTSEINFRISIAHADEDEILVGIRKIANVLNSIKS